MSVPNPNRNPCVQVTQDGRQLKIFTSKWDEATTEERATSDLIGPDGVADTDEHQGGGRGDRQAISGFTERSRRNLRRQVHAVRRDAPVLFVTLTYHETDPHPRTAKKQLERLWKKIKREFSGASCVWKMEPQKRGTVHFHLLVFGVDYIPIPKLAKWWHERTNETSEAHLRSGVDIERNVNQDGKIQSYLAKYLGKTCGNDWDNPGRFWGWKNRDAVPWATDYQTYELSSQEARRLVDMLLSQWDVDIPDGVAVPALTVNTYGDPKEQLMEYFLDVKAIGA